MKSFDELDQDAERELSRPWSMPASAPVAAPVEAVFSPPPLVEAPVDEAAAVREALAQRMKEWDAGGTPSGPSSTDMLYGRAKPPPRQDALGYAEGADTLLRGSEAIQNQIRSAFGAKPMNGPQSNIADGLVRSRIEAEKQKLRADADGKRAMDAALQDPNSAESKELRDLYAKANPELAAQLGDKYGLMKGSAFGAPKEVLAGLGKRIAAKEAASAAAAAKADAEKRAALEYDRRRQIEQDNALARIRETAKNRPPPRARDGHGKKTGPGGEDLGKTMPAGEASAIGQLDAADQMLSSIDQSWEDKTGAFSGLTQYVPGTSASQFDDDKLAAAQMVGTIMEGGKLTDSDLKDKYLPMMPSQGDGKARKDAKISLLRQMLKTKRESSLSGLHQGGYNTSGFKDNHMEMTDGDSPPSVAPAPDTVMVIPPGGTAPVPIHKSKLEKAIRAGGKLVGQ